MYIFDEESQLFLGILSQKKVEFLLVGGFAVNFHGYNRSTGDLDLWWNPTVSNFTKLIEAIEIFGYDVSDLREESFKDFKKLIRLTLTDKFDIELLPIIDGNFSFDEALSKADQMTLKNIPIPVLNYDYLIRNKVSSHRPKDLHDIAELDKIRLLKQKNKN
jgi:hypothetical protein